jgi:hypothetical protein
MKRDFAAIMFVLVFVTAGVFADHHRKDTWGLGVHGRDDLAWDTFYSFGGPGLSVKAPRLPLFWDISLGLRENKWFSISLSGDYYFIDKTFVEEINLGWFLGVGVYANFTHSGAGDDPWSRPGLGLRAPVGISWIYRERLEVFLDLAPSLGIGFWTGTGSQSGINFPDGSLIFEAGCRYWFK